MENGYNRRSSTSFMKTTIHIKERIGSVGGCQLNHNDGLEVTECSKLDETTSSDTDMCSCDSGCSPSWNSSSATTTPSYSNTTGNGVGCGVLKFTFDHKTSPPSCGGDGCGLSESAPTSPRYSRGSSSGQSTFAMLSDRWKNRKGSSDSATSSDGNTKLSRLLRRTRSAGCSKDVPAHALFLRETEGQHQSPEADRELKMGRFKILAMDMKEKLTFSLKTKQGGDSVRPTPEEARRWSNSFQDLISSKFGLTLFRVFLSREFSEENLEFWLICEKYKNSKPQKLRAKARKIYEKFVAFQAPHEVNLDTATREATIKNMVNPDHQSFDQAQRRIQGLMENDAYIRFLKSDMYLEYLSEGCSDITVEESR